MINTNMQLVRIKFNTYNEIRFEALNAGRVGDGSQDVWVPTYTINVD